MEFLELLRCSNRRTFMNAFGAEIMPTSVDAKSTFNCTTQIHLEQHVKKTPTNEIVLVKRWVKVAVFFLVGGFEQ